MQLELFIIKQVAYSLIIITYFCTVGHTSNEVQGFHGWEKNLVLYMVLTVFALYYIYF
jgi:hypothetical protein